MDLHTLTATIAAAYVRNNTISTDQIPVLIRNIHTTLVNIGESAGLSLEKPHPAVPIRRSVTDKVIICLDCGKQGQLLKRHLTTVHHLTPDEYRERWGLGPDYPMLAHNYSERRSVLAKEIGLGVRHHPGSRQTKTTKTAASSEPPKRSRGKTADKTAENR